MTKLHRSFMFSGIEKYLTLLISLLTTAIIARLLTPDEIGVFVVGSATVMMAEVLRDFGTSVYLVQEREISSEGVRTTFTIMLLVSIFIAAALQLLAAPLAAFYTEPRLDPVIRIASISVALGAFASPPMALLRRDLAFGSVALVNLAGVITNSLVALLMIALGWGYLSLAIAAMASSVAIAIAAVVHRPGLWIFRPCLLHGRKILAFGGYASATAVLNVAFQVLPQMYLGRLIGFDAVGIYSRAVTLYQLPERAIVNAFQPVVLPALAAEARAGRDLKKAYLHGLSLLTAVQWPALLCLAVLADPVVQVLLGAQWGEAAPLLKIMALASILLFPAPLTYPMLIALGRVQDGLTASLVSLPISAALIIGAAPFGLKAIAATMFLSAPLQVYVAIFLIRRQMPLRWIEISSAIYKSAYVAVCTAIPAGICLTLSGDARPVATLALAASGAGAGWIGGLALTRHPLAAEMLKFVDLVFSAVKARTSNRR
ncbi:oligosaccharide flippase family protein [Microvirga terricola]|uniref:Oligosaccharide flippase family protein n=1 Tax=Microvirga terricola TaxID=2719797 RepID=A0ABX0V7K7_9HYPH|nr:oligosaccharide flippase family protein [Microvirga terricola]NIX75697.1 oligosaccharide flippase family protein [Microvirga terricola]